MNELDSARKEINEIDAEMAKLFERRIGVCRTVASYKKERGLSVKDPSREAELIQRNKSLITDPDAASYYPLFIRNMIDLSSGYQSMLIDGRRVAYSGEAGAFAYIAAKKMFPESNLIAYPDFNSAYRSVEQGETDCSVLPLENSYAGEVGTVMDLIFSGSLYINQVIDVPISHYLLANKGASFDTVRTVVSHPQAIDQCSEFIRKHSLQTETYSNTALAAKYVMDSGRTDIAAIASSDTADIFNLKVLESNINDSKTNTTRFASFSRTQNSPESTGNREDENFILVFTVRNEAGALAQTLDIVGSHGYNMRSLRSRPMKELQWKYFFYIEAEGNINNENGKNLLRELSAICANLKLVGTYYANNVNEG